MTEPKIHPTAIIDAKAELDSSVEVGPYAIIEGEVRVGPGTRIAPHAHIQGITEIGARNVICTGVIIGHAPQHIAYRGEPRRLVIGDKNVFREGVSVHRAFAEDGETRIGNECLFMACSHVAHDCVVGNRVILVNGALLAGHATIGDGVIISGLTALHQFCRVGRLAMLGGMSRIAFDVPPFVIVEGNPSYIRKLNTVGLQRAGLSEDAIKELRDVYKKLYRTEEKVRTVIAGLDLDSLGSEARELVDFYLTDSTRSVTPPISAKIARGVRD